MFLNHQTVIDQCLIVINQHQQRGLKKHLGHHQIELPHRQLKINQTTLKQLFQVLHHQMHQELQP